MCYCLFMNRFFEEKLTYNKILFRYAKGKSIVSGNEIHPYGEILYYIDGDATFLAEDFKEKLTPGSLLIIPKENYHNFRIENQDNYTRFVINFPILDDFSNIITSALSRVRIIKNINGNMQSILNRMCEVIRMEIKEETSMFLYGSFLSLVSEICFDNKNVILPYTREREDLIFQCIQYIDGNFTSDISIDNLADKMNVSPSTLFHCFKKELGISLHKYIIEKRMIYAHKLLANGEAPTNIYLECGYNDYSSFYKAYLKMFGHSPSADKA